jgi:hypothetical protein
MNFYDLFELSQLKAIQVALEPTLESVWRIRCREYSEKFCTPLHLVMNELDPQMVLQALYEEKYQPSEIDGEIDGILEMLYKIKDPNYSSISKEDLEDLVDSVLNKEIKRLSKKKKTTEEKITSEKQPISAPKTKSGSMNFSEIEKIDSLNEEATSGFRD